MCKGCTKSYVSHSLELMKKDENYRIAMFLKQFGWKKPTENSYEVWSGGVLLYGKTVHCKPDTTIAAECFAPTLEEIYSEIKEMDSELPDMKELIDRMKDVGFEYEYNELETAAYTWAVENIYKDIQQED